MGSPQATRAAASAHVPVCAIVLLAALWLGCLNPKPDTFPSDRDVTTDLDSPSGEQTGGDGSQQSEGLGGAAGSASTTDSSGSGGSGGAGGGGVDQPNEPADQLDAGAPADAASDAGADAGSGLSGEEP